MWTKALRATATTGWARQTHARAALRRCVTGLLRSWSLSSRRWRLHCSAKCKKQRFLHVPPFARVRRRQFLAQKTAPMSVSPGLHTLNPITACRALEPHYPRPASQGSNATWSQLSACTRAHRARLTETRGFTSALRAHGARRDAATHREQLHSRRLRHQNRSLDINWLKPPTSLPSRCTTREPRRDSDVTRLQLRVALPAWPSRGRCLTRGGAVAPWRFRRHVVATNDPIAAPDREASRRHARS